MDVSIKQSDKQAREAITQVRDDKETVRAARKNRKAEKRGTVVNKRLRRRIEKKVRADLLTEKQCYLKGEPSDSVYTIDTRLRYGWPLRRRWRHEPDTVKRILREVLAEHTGFEYEADYCGCRDSRLCDVIRVQYTLLDQTTTPSGEEST